MAAWCRCRPFPTVAAPVRSAGIGPTRRQRTGYFSVQRGGTFQVHAATPQSTTSILNVGIGGGALDASGAGTVTFNGTANTRIGTDTYTEAVVGDGYSNFTLTGNGNGVMNGSILLLIPPQSAGNYGGGTRRKTRRWSRVSPRSSRPAPAPGP